MDTLGSYTGGVYTQHISKKEIEKMKKNMKKVPAIQLKTEIYHNHESYEADSILNNITQEEISSKKNVDMTNIHLPWYKRTIHHLHRYFTSLYR